MHQSGDYQRSSRRRTGEPPGLFKMESSGRRDRGGIVAAYRAGSVAAFMIRLRSYLKANQIDPEIYSSAPDQLDFAFELRFPPRINLVGKADLAVGEDAGENAFLIATSSGKRPNNDREVRQYPQSP
jgi:hypothetical protein